MGRVRQARCCCAPRRCTTLEGSSALAVLSAGGIVVFPAPRRRRAGGREEAAAMLTFLRCRSSSSSSSSSSSTSATIVVHGVNTLVVVPTMLRGLLRLRGAPRALRPPSERVEGRRRRSRSREPLPGRRAERSRGRPVAVEGAAGGGGGGLRRWRRWRRGVPLRADLRVHRGLLLHHLPRTPPEPTPMPPPTGVGSSGAPSDSPPRRTSK